jgi:CheY-like chemotaxis protein
VDDTPQNLQLLGAILDEAGYEVRVASNGPTALSIARISSPDLILLDILMPGMDGYEVCRTMKSDPALAEIPIIFLTALNDKETVLKAFDQGAADFITKPFDRREILARVRTHLELFRGRRTIQEYARQLKAKLDRTEADEEAGRKVQFSLLPPDGLRFGCCEFRRLLVPSMHMCGDFVDYFAIDDTRHGFYMLDVAGHGVASAFVTVLIKNAIGRALDDDRAAIATDPARLLAHLNREILRGGMDKHAAIFFAVLDRDARELRFANGGYFPFPILASNGNAQWLESRSKPIGLFDTATYATHSIALPEAFTLMLFSDGVLDILPEESLKDKLARLESIGRSGIADPAAISRALCVDHFRERPDDIAILTMARRPA